VKTLAFLLGLLALIAPTYLQAAPAPLRPYEKTPSKENCRLTAHDFGNCRPGLALPRVAKGFVAVPAPNNPSNRAILAV
jgi:hypothetical protein